MSKSIKDDKESVLYQKGYRDGFIEGQTEGVKLVQKTIESGIHPQLILGTINADVGEALKSLEVIDLESNPDGDPMRITPIEEEGK